MNDHSLKSMTEVQGEVKVIDFCALHFCRQSTDIIPAYLYTVWLQDCRII